jgi:N-glycosylase/DNA lyase
MPALAAPARLPAWGPWRELRLAQPISSEVLGEILDGGQSFRWRRSDHGWVGVFGRHVAEVAAHPEGVRWRQPRALPDVGEALAHYLDAAGAQAAAADALPWRSDPFLAAAMRACPGLRILAQEPDEALLAFLCSSNKQVAQIRVMVHELATRLGEPLVEGHHALPSWSRLARAEDADLRSCRLGYRAAFIRDTARVLERRPSWAAELRPLPTPELEARLAELPGVGPKVAACVALFGFGRLDAFPVDTWIDRVLTEGYDLHGWNRRQLARFGAAHYGGAAGLAQQFLFAAARRR